MDDDEIVKQEEIIELYPWSKLTEILNHNELKKHVSDYSHKYTEKYPQRMMKAIRDILNEMEKWPKCNFEITLKKLFEPKKSKSLIPKKAEILINLVDHTLLCYQRDIVPLLWEEHLHRIDILLMTISMIQLVEDFLYFLDDEKILILSLEIFNLLMLRDAPYAMIVNCLEFQELVLACVDKYYLKQTVWSSNSELVILTLSQLTSKFSGDMEFRMELITKILECYNYHIKQRDATRKMNIEMNLVEASEEEYILFGLGDLWNQRKGKKKQMLHEEGMSKPEELFLQVPEGSLELILGTMCTFPIHICDTKLDEKWALHHQLWRRNSIFHQTLAIKILQNVATDNRYRITVLHQEYQVVEFLQRLGKYHEYFNMQKESIKILINLLYSFDEMILWMKFDSNTIYNENSNYLRNRYKNQVIFKPFGNPYKLPQDTGLYLDCCGIDFRQGDGIEIIGHTRDFSPFKTQRKGFQLPSQISLAFWFVYFTQKTRKERNMKKQDQIHTLLGNANGETSLLFFDPNFVMIGVTNVGDKTKAKDLNVNLQNIGMKLFKINLEKSRRVFQGWNQCTVLIDNINCRCKLFMNGHDEGTIEGIYSDMNIGYIGNNKNGLESFGYVCDLRIYPRLLEQKQIKYLCHYIKTILLLNPKDVLTEILDKKIIQDLKRVVQDHLNSNPEAVATALEAISLICFSSTRMRLEVSKQGVFELVSSIVQHDYPLVTHFANQVLQSIW